MERHILTAASILVATEGIFEEIIEALSWYKLRCEL